MKSFDLTLRTRVVFGENALDRLGELARELGFVRTRMVADPGIVATGAVERAAHRLSAVGIVPSFYHDFGANPYTAMVERGRQQAAARHADSIVALGGGSSLDCA